MIGIIAFILIFAAPIVHAVLCYRSLTNRVKLSIGGSTGYCFLLGVVSPLLASYMLISTLPENVKCITGEVGCAVSGIMITFIFVPIITVVSYIVLYLKTGKYAA